MGFKNLFKKNHGPKFKVGERIKCIDDREHSVVFAKVYVVINVLQIPCCGDYCYDVGLVSRGNGHTRCGGCSADIPGHRIHWAAEFRFAPNAGEDVAVEEKEEEKDTSAAQESLLEQVKEILETAEALN